MIDAVRSESATGAPTLSDGEFYLFRDWLLQHTGVELPLSKKPLVSGRLGKRLRERRVSSFKAYFQLMTQAHERDEWTRVMDLLTTHETYFFREPQHFDFLSTTVLPLYADQPSLRVWSAASSTGEEAYSLAMTLCEQFGDNGRWQIVASDVSPLAVKTAATGVYSTERSDGISEALRKRYCLKGIGSKSGTFKIVPGLQKNMTFTDINLNESVVHAGEFDIIFVRNVLIYFDAEAKQRIVNKLCQQLRGNGWLFVGHAETLSGMCAELSVVKPTIYRRIGREVRLRK